MEQVNAKSVLSTTFQIGTFQMPIRLYKSTDRLGLSGKLFHDGCSGKIRQWKTCENHPNTEDPATFSGMEIGNKVVPLTSELKKQLLDGNVAFEAIGAYKSGQLSRHISEQRISVMEPLEMMPEKYFEVAFSTLLERLRIRHQFLLVRYSKENMRRYGILLHTGLMLPIRYVEEVRPKRFEPLPSDRTMAKTFNAILDELEGVDFPDVSAEDMLKRIQAWFTDVAMDRTIVAYTYKIKERVDA